MDHRNPYPSSKEPGCYPAQIASKTVTAKAQAFSMGIDSIKKDFATG